MSAELAIFARFHVREDMEAAAAGTLAAQVAVVRREAGCLSIDAYRSIRDGQLFFIHSRWMNEAAFEAHAALPNTARFIADMESLADQPIEVTRSRALG